METIQTSKLTSDEIQNIIQLLQSPENINRQLGVVLAISGGMSIDELVDGIATKKWFYDDYFNRLLNPMTSSIYEPDFTLGEYLVKMFECEKHELYFNDELIKIFYDCREIITVLIGSFIEESHPHLLSKITPI